MNTDKEFTTETQRYEELTQSVTLNERSFVSLRTGSGSHLSC